MKFPAIAFMLIILASQHVFGNDSAFVVIQFEEQLSTHKFRIFIQDGKSEQKIPLSRQMSWRGELVGPYGHISIEYSNSDTTYLSKRIFFKKGNSSITVIPSGSEKEYFTIHEKKSDNIIPFEALGGDAFTRHIKPSADSALLFFQKYRRYFASDTSLFRKAKALTDVTETRIAEFIQNNPQSYVAYWVFLTELVKSTTYSPDQLQELYDTSIPDTLKQSKAGAYLAGLIQIKKNLISQKAFPEFSATDLNKQSFSTASLKGKYVLIQFWASWCIPCLREMPELKKIHAQYGNSPLQLISFSIDKDSVACRRAIDKHQMDWPQVYGDMQLFNSLNYTPIPQLYLIDKSGSTIYNSTMLQDSDLALLKQLLADRLGK